jgi:phosphoribosylformimino-5-aminoimidazole carboxamide ribotide isomerase
MLDLYPAIDLLRGRIVRLRQGRFDQVTDYGDDPIEVAQSFAQAGAQFLHIVDLDGSRDGAAIQADLIRDIVRNSELSVQVGGGIRNVETAAAYVESGVSRVVIGSLAAHAPERASELIRLLGPERVTLAVDVRSSAAGFSLAVQGWTEAAAVSPWRLIEGIAELGVDHILCTDISRDGELSGPNLDLYRELLSRFPRLKLLASGGVASLDDLRQLANLGASGAIVGKALYSRAFSLEEALRCCANG